MDDDNFDSSIPPPDDCSISLNANPLEDTQASSFVTSPLSFHNTFTFGYPYVDELSFTHLPIDHHPDFSNIGARLELCEESDSFISSNNDDNNDDDDIEMSSSPYYVDELPSSSIFSGFLQHSIPDDVRVINDSRLHPADEALLSLVIGDNHLPQEMYNKILDWAHFARLSHYNIPKAIEYHTSLHRMHSKYANVCSGSPLSEIVEFLGTSPCMFIALISSAKQSVCT